MLSVKKPSQNLSVLEISEQDSFSNKYIPCQKNSFMLNLNRFITSHLSMLSDAIEFILSDALEFILSDAPEFIALTSCFTCHLLVTVVQTISQEWFAQLSQELL